jgi:general secretion pathway protein J
MTRQRGFTLLELVVALTLLGLMSSVLFGALAYAGRSWEGGEAKAVDTAQMRLVHEHLRAQLTAQHPLRMRKIAEFPLLFGGERDELRFAATLPPRISGAGLWYYRLRLDKEGDEGRMVLERIVPDLAAPELPEFDNSERSILADDIKEVRIGYLGFDNGVAPWSTTPTWRDRWDDRNRLPLSIRIDVIPERGPAWPTLFVVPRQAPESGCRRWDPGAERCVGVI